MQVTTLIAPVKNGREDVLEGVLSEIGSDLLGNPYLSFGEDTRTHFARCFVLEGIGSPPRLVFSAIHNDDEEGYIEHLGSLAPGLDAIWGECVGYRGRQDFGDFARRCSVPAVYTFAAYPNETVTTIRTKMALRQRIEQIATPELRNFDRRDPRVGDYLDLLGMHPRPGGAAERWVQRLLAELGRSFRDLAQPLVTSGSRAFSRLGEPKSYTRLLDVYSDPAKRARYLERGRELAANVSPFLQNQLTVVAPVLPGRLRRLRLALTLGGVLARYGYPAGELSGTFTIHFLHWVIIDNGRTGIVMSNYDGSWESYLGDFADKMRYGLDALFNNCADYPPGGLQRIEAWGQWIRDAQMVVPVFYSGYPQQSALVIGRDRAIAEAAVRARASSKEVARLLALL